MLSGRVPTGRLTGPPAAAPRAGPPPGVAPRTGPPRAGPPRARPVPATPSVVTVVVSNVRLFMRADSHAVPLPGPVVCPGLFGLRRAGSGYAAPRGYRPALS